jgi:ribose transport system substrate-binding protein
VNGDPVNATLDRVAGVTEVLQRYPEIKILSQNQNVGGIGDGGLRVMSDLLTAFPKIDAVFAVNDPSGIGADLAARQAQAKRVIHCGRGRFTGRRGCLERSASLFAATAAQDPYAMAQKAVELGCKVLDGESLETPTVLIPVQLVYPRQRAGLQGMDQVGCDGHGGNARPPEGGPWRSDTLAQFASLHCRLSRKSNQPPKV